MFYCLLAWCHHTSLERGPSFATRYECALVPTKQACLLLWLAKLYLQFRLFDPTYCTVLLPHRVIGLLNQVNLSSLHPDNSNWVFSW